MIQVIPESMHPTQFFHIRAGETPERKLVLAVLERAFQDLIAPNVSNWSTSAERARSGYRVRQETRMWFLENDQVSPYSFVNCCEWLDLDADAVRAAIRDQGIQLTDARRYRGHNPRPCVNRRSRAG